MAENDKVTARERYDKRWPPISCRVSRETHELLKNLAERRGLPIGRFCGDILTLHHCGNCRSLFRRKQPTKIVEELRSSLGIALEENKAFREKNMSLVASVEDWQRYAGTLQEKIKTLNADLKPSEQYTKIQEKAELFQRKLDESEKSNLDIQADWERLNRENAELRDKIKSLEDAIQGYKDSKVALQRESVAVKESNAELRDKIKSLEDVTQDYKEKKDALQSKLKEWEAWWGTVVGDKSILLQSLAEEVGVSQAEILKDLIEYGYAHSGDIYIEDLEVQ